MRNEREEDRVGEFCDTLLYLHPKADRVLLCRFCMERWGSYVFFISSKQSRIEVLNVHEHAATNRHKDYLFQKRLALRLPLDSFRFDFRYVPLKGLRSSPIYRFFFLLCSGNHESGGTWKQAAIHEDVEDLRIVVAYLTSHYGYEVDLVVGHSRGSVVGMSWCCTSEEGKKVGGFVNASGRYRMEVRDVVILRLRVLSY